MKNNEIIRFQYNDDGRLIVDAVWREHCYHEGVPAGKKHGGVYGTGNRPGGSAGNHCGNCGVGTGFASKICQTFLDCFIYLNRRKQNGHWFCGNVDSVGT